MRYYKTGIASVSSIQNAILEILGDIRREQEERKRMHEYLLIISEPKCEKEYTDTIILTVPVCVCTCVNCNRSYEVRPRWNEESTRKVLCALCRGSYERG